MKSIGIFFSRIVGLCAIFFYLVSLIDLRFMQDGNYLCFNEKLLIEMKFLAISKKKKKKDYSDHVYKYISE